MPGRGPRIRRRPVSPGDPQAGLVLNSRPGRGVAREVQAQMASLRRPAPISRGVRRRPRLSPAADCRRRQAWHAIACGRRYRPVARQAAVVRPVLAPRARTMRRAAVRGAACGTVSSRSIRPVTLPPVARRPACGTASCRSTRPEAADWAASVACGTESCHPVWRATPESAPAPREMARPRRVVPRSARSCSGDRAPGVRFAASETWLR